MPRRRVTYEHTHWTTNAILRALRRWYALYGEAPRADDWTSSEKIRGIVHTGKAYRWFPTNATVRRVFGTWNEALIAAGLPVRFYQRTPVKYTDDELLRILRSYPGRPTTGKWTKENRNPTTATYIKRFGSWNRAMKLAGYQPIPSNIPLLKDPQ